MCVYVFWDEHFSHLRQNHLVELHLEGKFFWGPRVFIHTGNEFDSTRQMMMSDSKTLLKYSLYRRF